MINPKQLYLNALDGVVERVNKLIVFDHRCHLPQEV